MAAKQDPRLGLNYGWGAGENGWNGGMDDNLKKLGSLVGGAVESVANSPTITTNGTCYIVGTSPTGDFAGQAGKLAARIEGAWVFYTPAVGWALWSKAVLRTLKFDGTNWTVETPSILMPLLNVSNPGGWTFSNAAFTKIPMYTVTTDTGSGWNTTTNDEYTIPSAGLWLLHGIARPIRSSTGALPDNSAIALGIGTGTPADSQDVAWASGPATGVAFTIQVQRMVRLNAGDKISMFSKHSHTAAVGFTYARLNATRLSD